MPASIRFSKRISIRPHDPDTVFDRSIDYLVLRLRRKLEVNPRRPELIKTEHGAGYVFTPEVVRY